MMNFFKKKPQNESNTLLNSSEYEKLAKKNIELSSELEELKTKFKMLQTDMDNLRGNFNRKLNKLKKEDVEEQPKEESINNSMLIPYNGTFK